MISPEHARLMARYNRWQNRSLYAAAGSLDDSQRTAERGAFFGSIHATLNHLLWGDQMWMHRFAGTPKPAPASIAQSVDYLAGWDDLARTRAAFDETIVSWADGLDARWLEGDLTWFSGAVGRELSQPKWQLVTHFFNHQTHHRGQVHAMLTAAGARPDDTDLMLLPA